MEGNYINAKCETIEIRDCATSELTSMITSMMASEIASISIKNYIINCISDYIVMRGSEVFRGIRTFSRGDLRGVRINSAFANNNVYNSMKQ